MPLLPLLLLLLAATTTIVRGAENALVEWLQKKPNGFFSEKIEWKLLDSTDPSGPHAMFASEDIPSDETLLVVPRSALITSKDSGYNCDTVKMLLEELEKGTGSDYFPYIDYLFGERKQRGNLPVAWSELGQDMLNGIIGDSLFPDNLDRQRVEEYCPNVLEDADQATELEQDAYLFMISRSWDDIMIPGKRNLLCCVVLCLFVSGMPSNPAQ